MRKKFSVCFLCVLITLIVAGMRTSGSTIQNNDIESAIKRARYMVLEHFTPLSGLIVDVHEELVKFKLDKEKNMKEGMRLSVFREGTPFYHPVTKELIGKTEDIVGRIEVKGKKSGGKLYIGTIISGDVNTEDIVRITSSKIKLAFFQDSKSDWSLSEVFYESLKDSGRFDILESYTSNYKPEDLSELAIGLNAEAVLMFSTLVKEKKKFLNIRLYWAEDAKMFAEIEEAVSQKTFENLTPDEELISTSLTDVDPWSRHRLIGGQLIAMGDVDKDGQRELAISDGKDIRIYNFQDELKELWFIKDDSEGRHLSIDVFDQNNNGLDEIFVTSIIGDNKIRSSVIEFDSSEGYRKIENNMPYFLRMSGHTLLMQKFNSNEIFSGPVYKGIWKDGHYQAEMPLKLPPDVNIYGFTFIDWQNNGQTYLMTFDDKGYLKLYDDRGNFMWKSSKTYGRSDLSFERETYSVIDTKVKWFIRGRLISVQTKRGQEVVVVNKIPVVPRMPGLGIKGAEVYSLWWNGGVMDEQLILREISGAITDYWVDGKKLFLIARGDLFTFVKNATSGEFSKGSMLYSIILSR